MSLSYLFLYDYLYVCELKKMFLRVIYQTMQYPQMLKQLIRKTFNQRTQNIVNPLPIRKLY